MANRLKMAEHNAILGLARLGWSFRRIAAEVGVDRETVARHVKAARGNPPASNAAISITGSDPAAGTGPPDPNAAIPIPGAAGQRSRCAPVRAGIQAQLERGLTAQRIWQDLKAEHGFDGSYQSVQRFVKRLRATTPLPFRRMESGPGEQAQIDFGRGAPIITPDGRRQRPHLLRVVLSCSRKAYSEVVPRQTTEHFIRALENAFWHFGGVPKALVTDNLKAAVIQADWYDPELNPKIQAFCQHYGTTLVPTRPRLPRHKGKVERGVGYAQSNALKGRTFDSLAAQNRFLTEWEAMVADTRIHGTTRQQVSRLFTEVERPALLPLPVSRFPCFQEGERIVNRDGHVEIAKAYYSAPPEFVGRTVWVRWDGHIVRVFNRELRQIAIHAQREPGRFATDSQHIAPAKRSGIERGTAWWLRKAHTIGGEAGHWAETVLHQRGVHAVRVIMGLVSLTHRHRDTEIEQACRVARSHAAYRLRDVRNLLKRQAPPQEQFEFTAEHPLIRSLSDYGALVHSAFEETSYGQSSVKSEIS
jgi:transposase